MPEGATVFSMGDVELTLETFAEAEEGVLALANRYDGIEETPPWRIVGAADGTVLSWEPAPPPLHPGTNQPIGPDDLAPLFPMELIKQVVSTEREIEIPGPVRQAYALYRPSPLHRAHRLEKALDTPAHIYYKYEGVSAPGSHKPNTAIAQAFYAAEEGVKRFATETGAGQWGSALAFACGLYGLECKVYMVRVSYDQKPYRRSMMETWGATVVPSPSEDTNSGRARMVAGSTPRAGGSDSDVSEVEYDEVDDNNKK